MEKTLKIVTYKYLFQLADMDANKTVGIKFVSETPQGHEAFLKSLLADDKVVKAMREYVGEYDCAMLGFTEVLKGKEEVKENEKV